MYNVVYSKGDPFLHTVTCRHKSSFIQDKLSNTGDVCPDIIRCITFMGHSINRLILYLLFMTTVEY